MLPTRAHTAQPPPWTPLPSHTAAWSTVLGAAVALSDSQSSITRAAAAAGAFRLFYMLLAQLCHNSPHRITPDCVLVAPKPAGGQTQWADEEHRTKRLQLVLIFLFSAPITDCTAWHFTTQLYFLLFFSSYFSKYFQQSSQSVCFSSSGYLIRWGF